MKTVKMLQSFESPVGLLSGDSIYDLDDLAADALIQDGRAVLVSSGTPDVPVESAKDVSRETMFTEPEHKRSHHKK